MKNVIRKIKALIKNKYFKYKIMFYINMDKPLVIKTTDKDRQIGKSTIIKELSDKYDVPVLIRFYNQQFSLKQKGVRKVIHVPSKENIRGLRSKNFYLVDEGFSKEEIENLSKFVKVYGFYYGR